MTSSINKKIAIGSAWTISFSWADRLMRLVSIAILARLLLPSDFGLVAYALVFLAILDEFSTFGFQTVLIRDQDATKEQYSTVWTLEVIKGVVLSILLVAGAKFVAAFFDEPEVETILYWIAATPILKGLVNIGTVDFQKNLELHKDFYFNLVAKFGGTISTLVLALVLRNYWALIYGSIIGSGFRVVLSYLMSGFRPRLTLSEFSRVLNFSKWLLVQSIFASLNKRLPSIVIGRYFNAEALAYFNMSRELSGMASDEFASPIRRALYPGITKMRNDHSRMADTLTAALGIIVLVGLPATIGIGLTAPLLIPAFLGENWISAAPIVTILSLFFAASICYPNSHIIYYSLDRPKITANLNILRSVLLLPTLLVIVPNYGALGAAWSLVAVNWAVIFLDYYILFRLTSMTISGVVSNIWRSISAVIFMGICITYTLESPLTASIQQSIILHLLYCVSIGIVSYVAAVLLLWRLSGTPNGPEAYCLRLARKILSRRA